MARTKQNKKNQPVDETRQAEEARDPSAKWELEKGKQTMAPGAGEEKKGSMEHNGTFTQEALVNKSSKSDKKRRQGDVSDLQDTTLNPGLPPTKKLRQDDPSGADPTAEGAETQLPANGVDYLNDPSGILDELMTSYEVTTMSVISSTKIQKRVTKALDRILSSFSFVGPPKPNVVMLYAKADVASKMITIADIVTREVAKSGGKWYQYNRLDKEMKVVQKKADAKGLGTESGGVKDNTTALDHDMDDDEDDDMDEAAFETMKTRMERLVDGTPKVRAVPVMTIYLSRVRIEKLRLAYGEQSNATSSA